MREKKGWVEVSSACQEVHAATDVSTQLGGLFGSVVGFTT